MNKKLNIAQGWLRAVLFFFTSIVLSGLIATCIEWFIHKGYFGGSYAYDNSLGGIIIAYLLNQIGWIVGLLIFRVRMEQLSISSLGLSFKGYGKDGLLGFGIAITIMVVGTLFLKSGDNLIFRGYTFDIAITLQSLFLFLVVALMEEIVVRGYILSSLMQSMNRWLALLCSALFFTIMHTTNQQSTPLALLNIFIAGILLGINYIYTKNLWFAMAFHFAWNFVQGNVFGYHVSGLPISKGYIDYLTIGPDFITGGAFGFEGSIFATFLQLLAIAGLTMYYESKYNSKTSKKIPIKADH